MRGRAVCSAHPAAVPWNIAGGENAERLTERGLLTMYATAWRWLREAPQGWRERQAQRCAASFRYAAAAARTNRFSRFRSRSCMGVQPACSFKLAARAWPRASSFN